MFTDRRGRLFGSLGHASFSLTWMMCASCDVEVAENSLNDAFLNVNMDMTSDQSVGDVMPVSEVFHAFGEIRS